MARECHLWDCFICGNLKSTLHTALFEQLSSGWSLETENTMENTNVETLGGVFVWPFKYLPNRQNVASHKFYFLLCLVKLSPSSSSSSSSDSSSSASDSDDEVRAKLPELQNVLCIFYEMM